MTVVIFLAAGPRRLAGSRQATSPTATDLADDAVLADALPFLADVPIAALHLGSHRDEDFRDADLVVVNPAVRPASPWLHVARRRGVADRTSNCSSRTAPPGSLA